MSKRFVTVQKVRRRDKRIYTEICNLYAHYTDIENVLRSLMQRCQCDGWYRRQKENVYDIILSGDRVEAITEKNFIVLEPDLSRKYRSADVDDNKQRHCDNNSDKSIHELLDDQQQCAESEISE